MELDPRITLVGLDFETTGLDVHTCRPLQIGVFIEGELEYMEYLRWEEYAVLLETNEHYQDAADVHKIPPEKIVRAEKTIRQVDDELHDLLAPRIKDEVLVLTQFSAWYDLTILKKWMPRTAALFSHRLLDPNTFYIVETALYGDSRQADLKKSKEAYRQFVVREYMDGEDDQHDALWDAKFAIHTVKQLRGWLE